MNACRDLEQVLSAYVDGETAAGECDRVRAHIEVCGPCRERVAGEQAARAAVRACRDSLRASAPEALRTKCAAHAAARAAGARPPAPQTRVTGGPGADVRVFTPRASFVRRWAPLSLAATVLLAVASVFGLGLNDKVQALAFQTAIDHYTCSRFKSPSADVDAATAAQQWQSRFGWPISVPASSTPSHLELHAVRRCLVTDGSVAHLLYSWDGEPLSVFVLPKRAIGDATAFARRLRHNTVMWSQNDRTYIMVTARPRDPSLEKVVAYVRANAY